jgi:hypothetical protein
MDGKICYLNTDLDLTSTDDLTDLAAELAAHGVYSLHVTCGKDGLWYATFETDRSFEEPEENIAAMLMAIESLSPVQRNIWHNCTRREFNIGYDCGDEPWAFNQSLSSELLGRVSQTETVVRITLYPAREDRK